MCERHFRQKHPSGNHLGPSPIPIILFWTLRIAAQVQISSKMALEKSRSSNALRSQMHYWKNYRKVVFKRPFYSEKRFRLNVHYVKTTSNHAAKLYYFLSFFGFFIEWYGQSWSTRYFAHISVLEKGKTMNSRTTLANVATIWYRERQKERQLRASHLLFLKKVCYYEKIFSNFTSILKKIS